MSHFHRAQWILYGGRRADESPRAARLLRLVGRGLEADLEIGRRDFTVRYDWHRSIHRYDPEIAPAVLSAVLQAARAGSITGPTRYVVDLSSKSVLDRVRWNPDGRIVWVLPGSPIKVMIRPRPFSPELGTGRLPQPIRYSRREVRVSAGYACVACGRSSTRFRMLLDSSWVCPSCGVSFRPVVDARIMNAAIREIDSAADVQSPQDIVVQSPSGLRSVWLT